VGGSDSVQFQCYSDLIRRKNVRKSLGEHARFPTKVVEFNRCRGNGVDSHRKVPSDKVVISDIWI